MKERREINFSERTSIAREREGLSLKSLRNCGGLCFGGVVHW